MRRLVLLGIVLVATGCSIGSDSGRTIEPRQLKDLVLQPADVPNAFIRFDEGRQAMADAPGGSRADQDRFGREGGWKARYRRRGTATTEGPLVVESRADVFDSGEGAEEELAAARTDLGDAEPRWRAVEASRIGDETVAMTLVQGSATVAVRYYVVAWRHDNVAASISVNGFDRRLRLEHVVELARKQQHRIAAAAES